MVIKVKHKEGRHFCNIKALLQIMWLSLFGKDKSIYVSFNDKSKYNLYSNDQWDWCKIIGRAQGGWKKGIWKSEEMVVWRYIPEVDEFHVAEGYFREDYKMHLPTTWEVIHSSGKVKISLSRLRSLLPMGGYFGGNQTPLNNLEYIIEVL